MSASATPKSARQLVAITGATGFIGRTIAEAARRDGWPVRALVGRPDAALAAHGIDQVAGRLEDEASLRRLVANAGVVIHCAGAIKARTTSAFHVVNAVGTERLLAAMTETAQSSRLILMSSLAAREPALSAYAGSKRAGEAATLADATANARDLCIIRPPGDAGSVPRPRPTTCAAAGAQRCAIFADLRRGSGRAGDCPVRQAGVGWPDCRTG